MATRASLWQISVTLWAWSTVWFMINNNIIIIIIPIIIKIISMTMFVVLSVIMAEALRQFTRFTQ